MKTLILLLLISFSFSARSQILVDNVNINKIDRIEYVELITSQYFKIVEKQKDVPIVRAVIDYGQKFSLSDDQFFQDEKGNLINFRSLMDALNFMTRNGWEIVNVYSVSQYVKVSDRGAFNQAPLTHYLLKKKA